MRPVAFAADDENLVEIRVGLQHGFDDWQELVGNKQRTRPAVAQNRVVNLGGKQRVERDRDDARLQTAPEDDREFDLVEHEHRRAFLAAHAMPFEKMREASGLPREIRERKGSSTP